MALKDFFDPAIEALDYAVGLRRLRRRQPMVDLDDCAQRVELMPAGRGALAQTEKPIGEFLAVIHYPAVVCLQTMRGGAKNGADAQRASAFQVT